jgi:transposase
MEGYLGIDVSKGYADFVLLNEKLTVLEPCFQLDDVESAHQYLVAFIKNSLLKHKLNRINCGVESTGGYENNWYGFLSSLSTESLRVTRLNPSVVKNASKAELTGNTTDSISARNIGVYLCRYHDRIDYRIESAYYSSFRSLCNHIVLLQKQKTQLINEFRHLIYSGFPELQRFCKSSIPDWVLELLKKYPSPAKLCKVKPTVISKIKGVTAVKAQQLIENAKTTVCSRSGTCHEFLIQSMAEEIAGKEQRIKTLKKHLANSCKGNEVELLKCIIGIADYSAATIMVEIEDIKRFSSPQKLSSYFGLHPSLKESGDKKFVSRMSKQGRPAVRSILYMCANTAVIYDAHMKAIYARHRAKGKGHNQALGVIMHKLIRVIWGVLTTQTKYDKTIDEQNQKAKADNKDYIKETGISNKRRFQPFDPNAPVSKKAGQKRKVQLKSQVDEIEQVRDQKDVPDVNL